MYNFELQSHKGSGYETSCIIFENIHVSVLFVVIVACHLFAPEAFGFVADRPELRRYNTDVVACLTLIPQLLGMPNGTAGRVRRMCGILTTLAIEYISVNFINVGNVYCIQKTYLPIFIVQRSTTMRVEVPEVLINLVKLMFSGPVKNEVKLNFSRKFRIHGKS